MVLSGYKFQFPFIMTLCQMSFSLFMLFTMRSLGLAQFSAFKFATAQQVLPLVLSFLGMVLTGLTSLGHLTVPMFDALRRTTTLITLVGQWYYLGQRNSAGIRYSIYIMVSGAAIAAMYDFAFDALGYILVLVNCFLTAAYLLYISKFSKILDTWALLYYCNLLSWPFVFVLCVITGDISNALAYPYINDTWFLICFAFQSGLAFILNYAIFLCTRVNSALATSVTGQVKNIMTTALGYFMFGDVKYHALNVVGLCVGVAGSAAYSWLKWREESQRVQQQIEEQRINDQGDGGGENVPLAAVVVDDTNNNTTAQNTEPEDEDNKSN